MGPGFDIQLSSYVYLVVAGLLFLLDMVFDLVMGFLPFYRKLFRPLLKQGTITGFALQGGLSELPGAPCLFGHLSPCQMVVLTTRAIVSLYF